MRVCACDHDENARVYLLPLAPSFHFNRLRAQASQSIAVVESRCASKDLSSVCYLRDYVFVSLPHRTQVNATHSAQSPMMWPTSAAAECAYLQPPVWDACREVDVFLKRMLRYASSVASRLHYVVEPQIARVAVGGSCSAEAGFVRAIGSFGRYNGNE